jgi:hypothetical protein
MACCECSEPHLCLQLLKLSVECSNRSSGAAAATTSAAWHLDYMSPHGWTCMLTDDAVADAVEASLRVGSALVPLRVRVTTVVLFVVWVRQCRRVCVCVAADHPIANVRHHRQYGRRRDGATARRERRDSRAACILLLY